MADAASTKSETDQKREDSDGIEEISSSPKAPPRKKRQEKTQDEEKENAEKEKGITSKEAIQTAKPSPSKPPLPPRPTGLSPGKKHTPTKPPIPAQPTHTSHSAASPPPHDDHSKSSSKEGTTSPRPVRPPQPSHQSSIKRTTRSQEKPKSPDVTRTQRVAQQRIEEKTSQNESSANSPEHKQPALHRRPSEKPKRPPEPSSEYNMDKKGQNKQPDSHEPASNNSLNTVAQEQKKKSKPARPAAGPQTACSVGKETTVDNNKKSSEKMRSPKLNRSSNSDITPEHAARQESEQHDISKSPQSVQENETVIGDNHKSLEKPRPPKPERTPIGHVTPEQHPNVEIVEKNDTTVTNKKKPSEKPKPPRPERASSLKVTVDDIPEQLEQLPDAPESSKSVENNQDTITPAEKKGPSEKVKPLRPQRTSNLESSAGHSVNEKLGKSPDVAICPQPVETIGNNETKEPLGKVKPPRPHRTSTLEEATGGAPGNSEQSPHTAEDNKTIAPLEKKGHSEKVRPPKPHRTSSLEAATGQSAAEKPEQSPQTAKTFEHNETIAPLEKKGHLEKVRPPKPYRTSSLETENAHDQTEKSEKSSETGIPAKSHDTSHSAQLPDQIKPSQKPPKPAPPIQPRKSGQQPEVDKPAQPLDSDTPAQLPDEDTSNQQQKPTKPPRVSETKQPEKKSPQLNRPPKPGKPAHGTPSHKDQSEVKSNKVEITSRDKPNDDKPIRPSLPNHNSSSETCQSSDTRRLPEGTKSPKHVRPPPPSRPASHQTPEKSTTSLEDKKVHRLSKEYERKNIEKKKSDDTKTSETKGERNTVLFRVHSFSKTEVESFNYENFKKKKQNKEVQKPSKVPPQVLPKPSRGRPPPPRLKDTGDKDKKEKKLAEKEVEDHREAEVSAVIENGELVVNANDETAEKLKGEHGSLKNEAKVSLTREEGVELDAPGTAEDSKGKDEKDENDKNKDGGDNPDENQKKTEELIEDKQSLQEDVVTNETKSNSFNTRDYLTEDEKHAKDENQEKKNDVLVKNTLDVNEYLTEEKRIEVKTDEDGNEDGEESVEGIAEKNVTEQESDLSTGGEIEVPNVDEREEPKAEDKTEEGKDDHNTEKATNDDTMEEKKDDQKIEEPKEKLGKEKDEMKPEKLCPNLTENVVRVIEIEQEKNMEETSTTKDNSEDLAIPSERDVQITQKEEKGGENSHSEAKTEFHNFGIVTEMKKVAVEIELEQSEEETSNLEIKANLDDPMQNKNSTVTNLEGAETRPTETELGATAQVENSQKVTYEVSTGDDEGSSDIESEGTIPQQDSTMRESIDTTSIQEGTNEQTEDNSNAGNTDVVVASQVASVLESAPSNNDGIDISREDSGMSREDSGMPREDTSSHDLATSRMEVEEENSESVSTNVPTTGDSPIVQVQAIPVDSTIEEPKSEEAVEELVTSVQSPKKKKPPPKPKRTSSLKKESRPLVTVSAASQIIEDNEAKKSSHSGANRDRLVSVESIPESHEEPSASSPSNVIHSNRVVKLRESSKGLDRSQSFSSAPKGRRVETGATTVSGGVGVARSSSFGGRMKKRRSQPPRPSPPTFFVEEATAKDITEENAEQSVSEKSDIVTIPESVKSDSVKTSDSVEEFTLTTDSESGSEKEDVPQKSKTYYISREILSTERTFVDALRLISEDFTAAVKEGNKKHGRAVIPDETLHEIMLNISQIFHFDQEFLKALEDRMEKWEDQQRIGDIIKRFSPFLKMYKTYIQGYDNAMAVLSDALKKYPQFAEVVKDFAYSERCQNLTIGMYMLKPIQRIPSYRLLLIDYLKHLSKDSLDHKDVSDALTIVSDVATHINEDMKRVDNFEEVLKVQRSLVGQVEIVKPGRELIKEGVLMKLCRKDMQPRMFYLFTDVLLYTTPVANNQFRLNLSLPLGEIKVDLPVSPDFDNEFSIITTKKSFTLSASTAEERDEWLEALRNASDEIRKKKITFHLAKKEKMDALMDSLQDNDDKEAKLGSKAPVWIPDARVTMCMLCCDDFTMTNRRHHCRGCGKVICGSCSSNTAELLYLNKEAARVCDNCYDVLTETSTAPAVNTTSVAEQVETNEEADVPSNISLAHQISEHRPKSKKYRKKLGKKQVPAAEESAISGYLMTRKGKKWHKRWYVVKDNVLYASKATSDVVALETCPLLGYDVRGPEQMDGDSKKIVFQLIHAGTQPVVLQTDNIKSAERWVNALRRATMLTY